MLLSMAVFAPSLSSILSTHLARYNSVFIRTSNSVGAVAERSYNFWQFVPEKLSISINICGCDQGTCYLG